MDNTLKQLQKEKEDKIKSMDMDQVKAYIERNVAYYYSHFVNSDLIYAIVNDGDKADEIDKESYLFKESFNNNLELILDNIKADYNYDSVYNQMRINFVICTLYENVSKNLMLNYEFENQKLKTFFDDLIHQMEFESDVSCLLMMFVMYTNTAYELFVKVQEMLLVLYELATVYDVDEKIFDAVNNSFKSLFLSFYRNFMCSKNANVNEIMENAERSVGKYGVENFVDHEHMMKIYENSMEKLDEISEKFDVMVDGGDLFSFPKSVLSDVFVDENVVYNLKLFDVVYIVDDDVVMDDDDVVSDTYLMMKSFEKMFNVDATVGNTGAIAVPDDAVCEANIDYLEDILL